MFYCIIYTCESGVVVILCTPQSIIFIIRLINLRRRIDISGASLRFSSKKVYSAELEF
jgi:hypothetical protein